MKPKRKGVRIRNIRERNIASAFQVHDVQIHRKGKTLPAEHSAYRARVVMALMKSGIPIAKLETLELRGLLEENGYNLTDPRHMMDLVPFISGTQTGP